MIVTNYEKLAIVHWVLEVVVSYFHNNGLIQAEKPAFFMPNIQIIFITCWKYYSTKKGFLYSLLGQKYKNWEVKIPYISPGKHG